MTHWTVAHLVATTALAGVGWVVQAVVYPAFALVGPAEWPAYHRRHQQAIALVVAPPWLLQAVSVLGLAAGGVSPTVALLGGLALAGVAATVFAAVPAHGRLSVDQVRPAGGPPRTPAVDRTEVAAPAHGPSPAGSPVVGLDPAQLRPLLRANLLRTLVWTASALVAALALLPGGLPFTP